MTHRALGAKLKELLDERGMTQVELARHLHLGKSTVSQYISGTRTPDLAMLVRLARFFSVSVDYLLGLSDVRWPAVLKDPDVAVVVRRAGELAPEQKARLLEYIDYLTFEAGRKESGRPGGASPDRPDDPT